jgi:hypothetical protein
MRSLQRSRWPAVVAVFNIALTSCLFLDNEWKLDCSKVCTDPCMECKPDGTDGTCTPVRENTRDNKCDGGACNGEGACKAPNGTQCTKPTQCISGSCVDGTCG